MPNKNLEQVLQEINAEYIALRKEEKRRNNRILKDFLEMMIENMKNDRFFQEIYQRNFFGGSYYDGLKVGKPDEYDLDIVLELPKLTCPRLYVSGLYPGYVQILLENLKEYERQPYAIPGFAKKFFDEYNNLLTTKVLTWMTGIVDTALNQFPTGKIQTEYGVFRFRRSGSGPAITVVLVGHVDGKVVNISIDLVPCFVFTDTNWPESPFRENPFEVKNHFFVVPKRPDVNETRYWRLSFQEQEKFLLAGMYHLKPSMRLIKRIRDVWDHKCIASYYIKTVFLWEVNEDLTLWGKPLNHVFLTMLKKYKQALENRRIAYYWDDNNNLLQCAHPETLTNFANKIQRIIRDVENFPDEPSRVIRHLVKDSENSERGDKFNDIIQNLDLPSTSGENVDETCVVM